MITDHWDGLIARAFNEVSNLGAYMDRFADKEATAACFLILCLWQPYDFLIWPTYIVPIAGIIVLEVLGYFIAQFHWRIEQDIPPNPFIGDNHAKRSGKRKMIIELVVLSIIPLLGRHISTPTQDAISGKMLLLMIPPAMLIVALASGIKSLSEHIEHMKQHVVPISESPQ